MIMKTDKNGNPLEIDNWVIDGGRDGFRLAKIIGADKDGDIIVHIRNESFYEDDPPIWYAHLVLKISEDEAMLHILENS